MIRLLRSPYGDGGFPAPEHKPEPPDAADVVGKGKTEKELELERELLIQQQDREALKLAKKKLETDLSHVQEENQRLREAGLKPAPVAKEKFSWMGFGGN